MIPIVARIIANKIGTEKGNNKIGIIISFLFDLRVIPPIILPNADKYKLTAKVKKNIPKITSKLILKNKIMIGKRNN